MTEHVLTLLVVDDDDVDREAVRRLLQTDCVLYDAATGEHARRLLRTVALDGVLLDYQLPGTDTLALIAECSAALIPVVILTGRGSMAVPRRSAGEGPGVGLPGVTQRLPSPTSCAGLYDQTPVCGML